MRVPELPVSAAKGFRLAGEKEGQESFFLVVYVYGW